MSDLGSFELRLVLPNIDERVGAAADNASTVVCNRHGPDLFRVLIESGLALTGANIPNLEQAIGGPGNNLKAGADEPDLENRVAVAFKGANARVRRERPDLDGLVGRSRSHHAIDTGERHCPDTTPVA